MNGDHGAWVWGSESKKWCRDLLHVIVRDPLDSAAGPFTPLDMVEDGAIIRVYHPDLGGYRQGVLHQSHFGFHVELSDSTGLEYLDKASGLNDLQISYYPKNNHIRGRMLYRVGDTADFLQVKLLPLNQTTYTDCVPTASLGQALTGHSTTNGQLIQNDVPPMDLRGIVNHHGVLFGLSRNTLRWTRQGQPDAWSYSNEFPDVPLAQASFNQSMFIFCRHSIWRVDGSDPSMFSISKTPASEGILAPRSLVEFKGALYFLGDRGVIKFDGYYTECITEERIYPWEFFPARQIDALGNVLVGTPISEGRTANSVDPHASSWIGAMEDPAFLNALGVDGAFGLEALSQDFDSPYAEAVVHLGKYLLFVPPHVSRETHGTWMIDLTNPGAPIQHLGLRPVSMTTEGSDIFLLTKG